LARAACEEFKEERELPESHHCTIKAQRRFKNGAEKPNYFFRLYRNTKTHPLINFYAANPNFFIQPESRRNEVLGFMKQGLQDFFDLPR
jgi:methionyl-tRNA synthetase